MDPDVARLAGHPNDAEEAQAELIARGPSVVPAVLEALPTLPPFGQLCAIDVLRELRASAARPALCALLASDDRTVRQWAAEALAVVGEPEDAAALKVAWDAARAEEPPGWTLNVLLREALTHVGARQPWVCPVPPTGPAGAWTADEIAQVIERAEAAEQLVLAVMSWKPWRETRTYEAGWSWEGPTAPWATVVAEAAARARAFVASQQSDRSYSADWVARSDVDHVPT